MPRVRKGTPHIDEYLFEGPCPPCIIGRLRERLRDNNVYDALMAHHGNCWHFTSERCQAVWKRSPKEQLEGEVKNV
jgi:hypothetical protein